MLSNKQTNWAYIYNSGYSKHFQNFCKYTVQIKEKISTLESAQRQEFLEKYLDFYNETIELFKYFILNNSLILLDKKYIILYIINSEILTNGIELYNLDRDISKSSLELETLIQEKYIDLFSEINEYFSKRLKNGGFQNVYDEIY
jgi:hypothetical protein